jgi:dihydrofolate reductase
MKISLLAALDRRRAIGRNGAMPWHLPDDLKRFKALTLGKPVLMGRKTALAIGRALPGRPNLVLTRADEAPYPGQQVVHSLDEALSASSPGGSRPALHEALSASSPGGSRPALHEALSASSPGGSRPALHEALSASSPGGSRPALHEALSASFPGGSGPAQRGAVSTEELVVIGGGEVYALAMPRATHLLLTWVDTETPDADTFFPAFDPCDWRETARVHHPADARHAFAFDFVDYERRGSESLFPKSSKPRSCSSKK